MRVVKEDQANTVKEARAVKVTGARKAAKVAKAAKAAKVAKVAKAAVAATTEQAVKATANMTEAELRQRTRWHKRLSAKAPDRI